MRSQHSGEKKAITKGKEMALYQALQNANIEFEYQKHIPFASCGLNSETKYAYADFVIARPWGHIILECDEDQHRAYDVSCDVRRDFDIAASVALGSGHKLMIVHYNPDAFRVNGKTRTTSQKDRIKKLLEVLEHEPEAFERVFVFYDASGDDATLPQVAASWDPAARQVSRLAQ